MYAQLIKAHSRINNRHIITYILFFYHKKIKKNNFFYAAVYTDLTRDGRCFMIFCASENPTNVRTATDAFTQTEHIC